MIEVVVGVDPGYATGISRVFPLGGWEGSFTLDHLSASDWIYKCAEHYGPRLVLAVEEFIPRQSRAIDWMPESVEVAGVCRFVSFKFGCGFVLQTPADAKSFVSNDRLVALGWWGKGSSSHARDADRQVLLYFARSGWYDGSKIMTERMT